MTIRSASLLAAAALAGLAAPALAQDYDPGPPPPLPDGDWQEVYEDAGDYPDDAYPLPPLQEGETWSYSPEQRLQWIEECRATYRDGRGEQRGQVIGGVVGGLAGGVAGNRIAGSGDRLGGTLLGAGVGTLAGAVVGGAVGRDSDRDRARDLCEAQFAQLEQSYRGPAPAYAPGPYTYAGYQPGEVGYVYPYPYPVMWVRVPIAAAGAGAGGNCGCEEVIEEVVEEQPVPRASRVVPVGDKRIRITK